MISVIKFTLNYIRHSDFSAHRCICTFFFKQFLLTTRTISPKFRIDLDSMFPHTQKISSITDSNHSRNPVAQQFFDIDFFFEPKSIHFSSSFVCVSYLLRSRKSFYIILPSYEMFNVLDFIHSCRM